MRNLIVALTVAVAVSGAMPGGAQAAGPNPDKGYWRAASNTASSITGDIAIADARLTLNMTALPLAPIRSIKPAEVSALFDADADSAGPGRLYRLKVPATMKLLHHNTLCGSDVTQWMVTYLTGKTLRVAFFSGDDAPVLTFDAVAHSTELCGTFTYER